MQTPDGHAPYTLQRQYRVALWVLVCVLALVTLTSVVSVALAMRSVDRLNEEIETLQTVNRDVLQDMTDAEVGIRSFALGGGQPHARQPGGEAPVERTQGPAVLEHVLRVPRPPAA